MGEKTCVNHLRVEAVNMPSGPPRKVICNLGHMDPGPKVGVSPLTVDPVLHTPVVSGAPA